MTLTAVPNQGVERILMVTFQGRGLGHPDPVTSFRVDYGDGSTPYADLLPPSLRTSDVSRTWLHRYEKAGRFDAAVVAWDSAGRRSPPADTLVYVSPCPVPPLPSNLQTQPFPPLGSAPFDVLFSVSVAGADHLVWDFGDAATAVATNPLGGVVTAAHTYTRLGTYQARVTSESDCGRFSTSAAVEVDVWGKTQPVGQYPFGGEIQAVDTGEDGGVPMAYAGLSVLGGAGGPGAVGIVDLRDPVHPRLVARGPTGGPSQVQGVVRDPQAPIVYARFFGADGFGAIDTTDPTQPKLLWRTFDSIAYEDLAARVEGGTTYLWGIRFLPAELRIYPAGVLFNPFPSVVVEMPATPGATSVPFSRIALHAGWAVVTSGKYDTSPWTYAFWIPTLLAAYTTGQPLFPVCDTSSPLPTACFQGASETDRIVFFPGAPSGDGVLLASPVGTQTPTVFDLVSLLPGATPATAPLTTQPGGVGSAASAGWDNLVALADPPQAGPNIGIHLWSLSTPTQPVEVAPSTCRMPGSDDVFALGTTVVAGRRLLVTAEGSAGIGVVDVTNPASPLRIGRVGLLMDRAGGIQFYRPPGGTTAYVYLSIGTGGVEVADVTDPSNPRYVTQVQDRYAQEWQVSARSAGLALVPTLARLYTVFSNGAAYACGTPQRPVGCGGVTVDWTAQDALLAWDLSDPTHPSPAGGWRSYDHPCDQVTGLGEIGLDLPAGKAWLTAEGALCTLPLDPVALAAADPYCLGTTNTPTAVAPDPAGGAWFVNPGLVGWMDGAQQSWRALCSGLLGCAGQPARVVVDSGVVYAGDNTIPQYNASGTVCLRVFDASSGALLGSSCLDPGSGGTLEDLVRVGRYLFAAAGGAGLLVWDALDPTNPTLVVGPAATLPYVQPDRIAVDLDPATGIYEVYCLEGSPRSDLKVIQISGLD